MSKNDVILSEFDECMRPSKLRFDKLQMWARVVNLPFNLCNDKWCAAIAKQIDEHATDVIFDHVNGYLRARVTVEVSKPLRRWILIESAQRKSVDPYDIQYENIPHFCFSCGRLGHSDLHCSTPRTRDANGELPFGRGLRVTDERKKASSSENMSKEHTSNQNNKAETRGSSTAAEKGVEVTSPAKNRNQNKRKGGPQNNKQVYRRVKVPLLTN